MKRSSSRLVTVILLVISLLNTDSAQAFDPTPPTLVSFSVSPTSLPESGGVVTVTLQVSSPTYGIRDGSVSVGFILGQRIIGSRFGTRVSGDDKLGTYQAQINFTAPLMPGMYQLIIFPLRDIAQNATSVFYTGKTVAVGMTAERIAAAEKIAADNAAKLAARDALYSALVAVATVTGTAGSANATATSIANEAIGKSNLSDDDIAKYINQFDQSIQTQEAAISALQLKVEVLQNLDAVDFSTIEKTMLARTVTHFERAISLYQVAISQYQKATVQIRAKSTSDRARAKDAVDAILKAKATAESASAEKKAAKSKAPTPNKPITYVKGRIVKKVKKTTISPKCPVGYKRK